MLEGAIPGTSADVYALGIMRHEALLGRRPSKGEQSDAQLARLPAGVAEVLTRCLAYAPSERYPSAVELADDLRPLRESLVATGAGGLRRPRPPPAHGTQAGPRDSGVDPLWLQGPTLATDPA